MGKHSDIDIDEMLRRIQENVEKQTSADETDNNESTEEKSASKKSPDELINLIMADIGEGGNMPKSSAVADKYDISGFEIEDIPDDEEADDTPEEALDGDEPEETEEITPIPEVTYEEAEPVAEQKEDVTAEIQEAVEEETLVELPEILVREYNGVYEAENEDVSETDSIEAEPTDVFEELSVETQQAVETSDMAEIEETVVEALQSPEISEEITELQVSETAELSFDKESLDDVTSLFVCKCNENSGNEPVEDSGDCRGLDEADINLAVSLGNKDSLEDAIGFVKVREAKHNFVDPSGKDVVGNIILDYRTREYKSYDENGEIKDRYRKEKKRIGLRLGISVFLFLVVFLCEIVFSFETVKLPYLSDVLSIPLVYGIVTAILTVSAVMFSAKKVFLGLIGFFTGKPNYYSTISFVFTVNLLYSVLSVTVFATESILVFNSAILFGLVLVIVGEFMQSSREILTFNLVSNDKPKISLETVDITSETTKKEAFLTGNEFVLENVNFVGKYFERSARSPQSYHARYTYTMLTMLLALLVAVIAVIVTKDFSYFVLAFELAVVLCIPIHFNFMGKLPFYIVSRKLYRLDSALIGETIDDEYVGPNTVYMDDVEVFGRHGIRVVNLEPHNGFNIVDVYYYYLSIFSKLESPLKNAFGDVSEKMRLSDNVKLQTVYHNGIEAVVDGKNSILIGKLPFMVEKNVAFGKCQDDEPDEKDDICVMYMAINGALCAKISLKYALTRHFEKFAEEMAENRVQTGVRTVDPNVTEKMIARMRGEATDTIRVIRPSFHDLVTIERRSNSGVITAKNPHMIVRILAEGLKIKKINSVLNLTWILYSFLGMGAVIAFSVFGIFDKVLPVYVVAYQFVWMIGLGIYIINKLRNRKRK